MNVEQASPPDPVPSPFKLVTPDSSTMRSPRTITPLAWRQGQVRRLLLCRVEPPVHWDEDEQPEFRASYVLLSPRHEGYDWEALEREEIWVNIGTVERATVLTHAVLDVEAFRFMDIGIAYRGDKVVSVVLDA
jgi:hypothetical protein